MERDVQVCLSSMKSLVELIRVNYSHVLPELAPRVLSDLEREQSRVKCLRLLIR